MWEVFGGPYLAAAGLLVAAGLPKLRDPAPLVRALRSVRLPAGRATVRLLAGVETLVGVAALVAPGRWPAALVAASYLLFTGFVGLALHRGGVLASCGCFGRPDTPPTRAHLVLTGALAVSAAALAVRPPGPWAQVAAGPGQLVVLAGLAGLLAWLSYVVIAVLPTVSAAAVRSQAPRRG